MSLYIITIERQEGITEYWSQYGGFHPERGIAKEYSEIAALMHLKNIHGIGRYGAEHKHWTGAKMEKVVHESITT